MLATGIVVDDAIVVIENIERHIQEYKVAGAQAASDAMGEVLGAVIATALVLIAVFVPVAFFPGTTGPALPAVLADDRVLGGALGVQRADADAGAVGAAARARRAMRKGAFFRVVERVIDGGTQRLRARRCAARMRVALGRGRSCSSARSALTYWVYRTRAAGVRARRGPGLLHRHQVQAPAGRVARVHDEHRAAGRADHR